ncbi:hypothetical protein [Sphingomonas sp.]|uniref:hypothetical protein n=1 Tax=Sphingomonas sp. TaxID=28214 RepID=UPI002CCA8378|nr:hypothetical protein [Sphingomonas sp.]HWK36526.1 hypothetical protein [Sphingomonas sp.]
MVAFSLHQRLTLHPATLTAVAAAGVAAATVLVLPISALESFAQDSGIAAFVPAAAPPLGFTARTLLAMLAGGLAGALAWAVVTLLPIRQPRRRRRPALRPEPTEVVPVLRRADAHPDAPPRAPLMATRELGTPFLDVRARPASEAVVDIDPVEVLPPAERHLPRDLDAPLSAYDPHAIPAEPATPVPPVAPLFRAPTLDEGERIDTFELERPAPLPIDERPLAAPRTEATIHALLDRLEKGVARRAEPAPPESMATPGAAWEAPLLGLETTLEELRRLAIRV